MPATEPYAPGERVMVSYTGYTIAAHVVDDPAPGYGGEGWVLIRQITDFEDEADEDRPVFEAGREYVFREGEPRPPGPWEAGWVDAILRPSVR